MTVRDETAPGDRWEFDRDVAEAFEDMLSRSIPQYEIVRESVRDVVTDRMGRIDRQGRDLRFLDLGTSRGDALASLLDRFGAQATYLGVEVSEPMLEAARQRFASWERFVSIENLDLRTGFPPGRFDAVLSILTLQFIPINYRQRIVRDVYRSLNPGGVFVVVEKLLGAGEIDDTLVDIYHRMKAANGYSGEQIERKRLALEGVLVPMTDRWNRELLYDAGFRIVDCFWRWMNFAGYVAVRD